MIVPEHIQDQCKQEAQLIVDTYNTKNNRAVVLGKKNLSLIANLCSLLLQVKVRLIIFQLLLIGKWAMFWY